MTDFLRRLAERQVEHRPGVAPRLPGRFEPPVTTPSPEPVAERAAISPAAPAVGHLAPPAPRELPVVEPARVGAEPADAPAPPAPAPPAATHAPVAAPPPDRPRSAPAPAAAPVPILAPAREVIPVAASAQPPPASPPAAAPPRLVTLAAAAPPPPPPAPEPLVPPAAAAVLRPSAPPFEPRTAPADAPVPIAHVTIGRLEVRAAAAPPPPSASEPRPPAKHRAMSLEEYLDGRRRRR